MRNGSAGLWVLLFVLVSASGCGEGPHLRLGSLLGIQIDQQQQPSPAWSALDRVGLVVHADETGLEAAPPISQAFLGTLSRRAEKFLTQHCRVSSVVPIAFPSSTHQAQIRQELISRGLEHEISHILLALFSSQEHSGPVTLGEERMMTQMRGISIENTALAEVALLRLSDYVVTFREAGWATETLEILDAPIGSGQPTFDQSLEILRAQAAQQALDRSLNGFGQWCAGLPEKIS